MNRFLTVLLFVLPASAWGLPLPTAGEFQIKDVPDQSVLYVVHHEEEGHISNTLIKLVQYYLLKDGDGFEVVFPHLSIDSNRIDGSYYAIGYQGHPSETADVKTTTLSGGLFASFIYQGNYRDIGPAIRSTFRRVLKTDGYVPHGDEEIRLLYWNSIDDNHPKDLITEILVRVEALP